MSNQVQQKVKLSFSRMSLFSIVNYFLLKEMGLIAVGLMLYLILISVFSHQHHSKLMTGFVLIFAIIKVAYILYFTLRRIQSHLAHSLTTYYRCLASFGAVVILTILSFSLDYLCLSDCNPHAFSGLTSNASIFLQFFELNYFSLVTFATIGFGDIVPVSYGAKIIVMLEIITSFVMVVFIISNFHNMSYPIVLNNGAMKEYTKSQSRSN